MSHPFQCRHLIVSALVALLSFAATARGQEVLSVEDDAPGGHGPAQSAKRQLRRETRDDPYRPPAEHDASRGWPPSQSAGTGFSVQVNVDDFGGNIPGDAANEPSIAVDPTAPNRLVIGWRQFDTIASNFRQAGWAYSDDGGRTWTFPGTLEPGVFRTDPVLHADTDGTIYYCSLKIVGGEYSVQFYKSFDGGVSWAAPLEAFGGDKQWFTIDRTGGVGHGNIYMSWNTAQGCCGNDIFTRSTDGGSSFLTPIAVPQNPVAGTLDVHPDGTLFICGVGSAPLTPERFYCVRSVNAQHPANTPVFDLDTLVDVGGSLAFSAGPNPGGLLGQVNLVVDRSDAPTAGNVYMLCSVDPPGLDPLDVMFCRSTDGGETFSDPVRVNDDAGFAWQWFGTMSVASNGRIDVVWNDTRNGGAANISELFYAFSIDGGESWSANMALSPPWDSHVGWPNQEKIGDYYELVSDQVGAHLAWAATFNGEQDVYYLRIGDYDCNDNGVGDAADIEGGLSADCNGNSIPDECEIAAGTLIDCPWDLDCDSNVGITDFLALLAAWGTDPDGPPDIDGDGTVGIIDFLLLLAHWGPCP